MADEATKDKAPAGANASTTNAPAKTTAADDEKEQQLIYVVSTLPDQPDGGAPLALSERHADHPNGEAFVAGAGIAELVAPTTAVIAAMSGNAPRLRKATAAEVKTAKAKDAANENPEK